VGDAREEAVCVGVAPDPEFGQLEAAFAFLPRFAGLAAQRY
jgi:hypothetical protein